MGLRGIIRVKIHANLEDVRIPKNVNQKSRQEARIKVLWSQPSKNKIKKSRTRLLLLKKKKIEKQKGKKTTSWQNLTVSKKQNVATRISDNSKIAKNEQTGQAGEGKDCIVMDYLRKTKMVNVGACKCSVIGGLMMNALDLRFFQSSAVMMMITVMMINMPVHFRDNMLMYRSEFF